MLKRVVPGVMLFVMALCLLVVPCRAEVARPVLHPLFQDHMVLQRGIADPVWGWATPGTKVTVAMRGKKVRAVADAQGAWKTKIGPFKAGGPYTLTVQVGAQTITLQDVMVGDVWICSGQSNMELGIGIAQNPEQEIKDANYPNMRLFTVPKNIAFAPQALPQGGSWARCTPESIAAGGYGWGGFSAVGYFFGRELLRDRQVPIGLIDAAWGGSIAEAWASREALTTMADFRPAIADVDRFVEAMKQGTYNYEQELQNWWTKNDAGMATHWEAESLDTTAWKTMTLPNYWEDVDLPGFDGVVWFRKTVTIPAAWGGKDLQLQLGPIDDEDTTWVNGVKVGATSYWKADRVYTIPGTLVHAGTLVIAVRVQDNTGGGGLYGTPAQLQVRRVDDPAAAISLAGSWQYQLAVNFKTTPILTRMDNTQNLVSVLYNGMIAPLVPFAIKGAIWYQGEANTGNPTQYQTLLPTLIKDWRSRFGVGNFPFLIVSLAGFMNVQTTPVQSGWAELREAQWLTTQRVPKTGIAMAIDIGDAGDIHPKNKQEVGRRLALAAENIAYGQKIEYSGPMYKGMKVEGNTIRLTFTHLGGGLVAKGDKLQGFAIAGADKQFVYADAVIKGNTIIVSAPTVAAPVAVRYGWANLPVCNLYNQAGLPAVPFRTDR